MTMHPMRRLAGLAVGWYPPAWRERYAEEVLDVLDQHQVSARTVANLAMSAAAARLDPDYRSGVLRKVLGRSVLAIGALACLFGIFLLVVHEPTEFGVTGAHDVTYSADGRLVLTVSGDSALRLWNVTEPGHPVELCDFRGGNSVSLSPDGHTIATLDGSVVLWNVTDPAHPTRAAELFDRSTDPEAAVFSPDGRTLAASYHESLVLFDVTDPTHPVQLTPLPEHPRKVPPQTFLTIRFLPGGRSLATTGGGSNDLTLWDISDPARPTVRGTLPVDPGNPPAKYSPMAFTPDGTILATTESTGLVRLWDVTDLAHPRLASFVDATATEGGRLGYRSNSIEVVITGDGQRMVTVMNNEKASVWDITDRTRPLHVTDTIRAAAGPGIFRISPDGHTVASAHNPSRDTLDVWTISTTAS
jgi:WD40 repeat protein